ncbi:MinD/ParA family ATP-binding protein [Microbacterium panaciterrae]|uniref:CobQ/CobB/MinD/ParA nucleotide binding domain-containing protein n=1 Tax=Microbacterium panaciterrae TaxID=985759 RepID=A0ABP8PK25_9MICO
MTTERRNPPPEDADDSLGVLDSAVDIGTAGIGLLGDATAQVPVTLPGVEDDDLVDDDVVDGEAYGDRVLDADPAAFVREDDGIGRIHQGFDVSDIVIEIPAGSATDVVVAELVDDGADAEHADEATEAHATDTTPPSEREPDVARATEQVVEHREAAGLETGLAEVDDVEASESVEPTPGPVQAELAHEEPSPVEPAHAEHDGVGAPDEIAPMPVLAVHTSVPAAEEEIVTPESAHVPESELVSRRLDQFADRERESADLLTADRLLDPSQLHRPEPEGLWSHLVYAVSGRRINLGDGRRAKERKALSARIAAPLPGTARFVPVLSRKGGVGKTTVTALLGMALADAREDRVIAVDANPDRGTLADRIARTNSKTVRDLVRIHDQVTGYHDISAVVSRDGTRLDVLASDADPRVSEAFSDIDYEQVASVAAHYYSLVLTDTGTGIVHSVMGATLEHADTIVIVAGLSVDEARLASETLTWLETNGYADKVRAAVVVLNQSTPGTPMVRLDELEAHFRTRVAHVLRIPYDSQIAAGSAITYSALQPETRRAARELAAVVVEGLRAQAA